MLLTELILAKGGPLAKVWRSAHSERTLSKQQALGVDVNESVHAILTQDVEPMTLRFSGQLMLGVVRIYGRKVQYLMDDCKETRERISMAFRPGMVDLPEDQIRANRNAITFTDLGPNIDPVDILDWTFSAVDDVPAPRGLHTAPLTQTNLRSREYGAFNFGRPAAESIYGDDGGSRAGSHEETSHLDSQDFGGIDLDIIHDDWDMEQGREAMRERSRSKSLLQMSSPVAEAVPMPGMDLDLDAGGGFDGMDLGLGLDMGLGDLGDDIGMADVDVPGAQDVPELVSEQQDREERHRRETSALSTPPPESPPPSTVDVTPRTAKRIADIQAAKPKRVRVARADEELELPDEEFAAPDEESDILAVERFIPADPEAVRLADVFDNPTKHFLPSVKVDAETLFFAGPAGLAPELSDLFFFNTNVLRRHRGVEDLEEPAAKRPRVDEDEEEHREEDDELEAGRRQSRQPSRQPSNRQLSEGPHFEPEVPLDFEVPPDVGFDFAPFTPPRHRVSSLAPSRAVSVIPEDGEYPLAMFDPRGSKTQEESLGSELGSLGKSAASESQATTAGGFSKTTGMAMGLLRHEIDKIAADVEDKKVSYDRLARGASKRAASGFFFELLVLGTRDCVRLQQDKPFGDIEVRAKERLWEL